MFAHAKPTPSSTPPTFPPSERCFRYVPPGSARSAAQPSAGAAAKGYFSGLRAANAGESNAEKTAEALPTRAEMSATVKAAARAAAARVSGDKGASAAAGTGGSKSGGGGGGSRDKIERDIFAARPSRGQALGVSAGGYDVYPETGDFETYDSDEVGLLPRGSCDEIEERGSEDVAGLVYFVRGKPRMDCSFFEKEPFVVSSRQGNRWLLNLCATYMSFWSSRALSRCAFLRPTKRG